MRKETLFEVKNLKKYFPITSGIFRRKIGEVKAVDGISFSIAEGEIIGLVGESGSGKSTAARTALRLSEPTDGEVSFLGRDFLALSPKELRETRRQIQMIFQDPFASLNPRKSVLDNMGEALLYHGIVKSRKEAVDEVVEILKNVGLPTSALNRFPHQFSGGQQQRISIGRAIALKPRLLFCDEAVSKLDLSVQAQILNLLYELKEKYGLSYLFISHDLSVVRSLCDRVYVMHRGKIVEGGLVEDIFERPKNAYTKTLLSAILKKHPVKRTG